MRPEAPRLFHRPRLVGCDPRVLRFFDWWAEHGPFPLTIPSEGGLRIDEVAQARLFAEGHSKAIRLLDTPHGRGGAADAYPAKLDPTGSRVESVYLDATDPATRLLFGRYGALAEAHGLKWGGRWKFTDLAHVEVPDWRSLPFPPTPESLNVA